MVDDVHFGVIKMEAIRCSYIAKISLSTRTKGHTLQHKLQLKLSEKYLQPLELQKLCLLGIIEPYFSLMN